MESVQSRSGMPQMTPKIHFQAKNDGPVIIDFEILADPSDPRAPADLMDQIDNALRSSSSNLRSGPSGFLLDGATLDPSPPDFDANSTAAPVPVPPQVFQPDARLPEVVPQQAAIPSFPSPPQADPSFEAQMQAQTETIDSLLARISEQAASLEELKSEISRRETEKGEILRKLADSETAVLERMKELDQLSAVLETTKKEALYAAQDAQEAKKALAQAKEMWMKESARATKLRDDLDKAELTIADHQKELSKIREDSKKKETENTNLKHLISKSNEIVSTQVLTPQTLDNTFSASDSYFVRGGTMASLRTATRPVIEAPRIHSSKYLHLAVTNDGVLFEDETIQIGIKAKFTGLGEGVLGVYYGNKTSGILQNFQTKYSLDDCGSHLHLTTAPLPSQIGPKSQICQRVAAQITGPFADSPKLTVSFLLPDNTPKSIPLRLPVTIGKFMQGRELSRDEFFSNWRQQIFVLSESSSVVNVVMNLAQIARIAQLGGALALHHQIDEVADNLVLVGQFPSDSIDGIRCATIPEALVLVRIEVGTGSHSGRARVAVRSNDPLVAEAVRLCLANQMGTAI